jgi:hypothetical protein
MIFLAKKINLKVEAYGVKTITCDQIYELTPVF